MPYANNQGIRIYYEVDGKGKPLVMIPGLGGDIIGFKRIIPVLSKEFQVIAMDNRGAGRSDKPDIAYTMRMMAGDVVRVLDTLNVERAHIFGLSMGGMIAQHFALIYPQKLISLVLASTTMGGSHSIGFEKSKNTVNPQNLNGLTPEESARRHVSLIYSEKFITENPELVKQLITERMQNPPDPVGTLRQFQSADSHDTYDRLPDIKAPTLVLAGDEDKVINPDNSRILASRIPHSELAIITHGGHAITVMEESRKVLLDFLRRH